MTSLIPPQFHLGSYLGQQAGEGLSEGLNKFFKQKESQRQLKGLSPFMQAAGFQPEQIDELVQSGIDPQTAMQAISHFAKQKQEQGVSKATLQDSFNRLWELSDEIGYSPFSPNFSVNTEKRAEFESEKASLVAALRDMVNKGVLSNQKFQYLVKEILPSHGDKSAKKRGNLKGVAKQLGLDLPQTATKNQKRQASNGAISMRDPETGEIYPVPKDQVNKYRSMGAEVVK